MKYYIFAGGIEPLMVSEDAEEVRREFKRICLNYDRIYVIANHKILIEYYDIMK